MWSTLLQNLIWIAAGILGLAMMVSAGILALRGLSQQNWGLILTGGGMFVVGIVVVIVSLGLGLAFASRDQAVADTGRSLGLTLVNFVRQLLEAIF